MTGVAQQFALSADDRVLLLAPHPDDETLAAGGLLQQATAAGAVIRILFVTRGDNNPWMQRLYEKRWNVSTAGARQRYGALRQGEALAALTQLGVPADRAEFLGFPDQGLTTLLMASPDALVERLGLEFLTFRPTLVVAPSSYDLHPDHSALAVFVRLALTRVGAQPTEPSVLHFIDHGTHRTPPGIRDTVITLTSAQREAKRRALACHRSQLAFRRNWLLSYATDTETYILDEGPQAHCEGHPVRKVAAGASTLWLDLSQRDRLGAFGKTTLCLAAGMADGPHRQLVTDLHWNRGRAQVVSLPDGTAVGEVSLSARWRGGLVRIPGETLGNPGVLFVKIERRFGFFDEAGWMEIPTIAALAPTQPESGKAGVRVCAVIPCYNVAEHCGPVVRAAAEIADHVIVVDDHSTDNTLAALRTAAGEAGGNITVLALPENLGKGGALLAAFRHAVQHVPFDHIITLDGDAQHRAEDIRVLAAECREGAEFVVGERLEIHTMPLRSRIGNVLTALVCKMLYKGCPTDTQSGFRAMSRHFIEHILRVVEGRGYEAELQVLLLSLDERRRIATVSIPTIYIERNVASHFRPVRDSLRIFGALMRWTFGKRGRPAGPS